MSTLRARLAIALAALFASAALTACGGEDSASTSDAAATTSTASSTAESTAEDSSSGEAEEERGSPESHIAPDREVTAGLKKLQGVAATIAASPDGDAAKGAAETALEPVWKPIEGTVKRNEPDLYLEVEDSFALLASGDLDQARRGRQRLDQAVGAYLAKHPG